MRRVYRSSAATRRSENVVPNRHRVRAFGDLGTQVIKYLIENQSHRTVARAQLVSRAGEDTFALSRPCPQSSHSVGAFSASGKGMFVIPADYHWRTYCAAILYACMRSSGPPVCSCLCLCVSPCAVRRSKRVFTSRMSVYGLTSLPSVTFAHSMA